jgi:hypothetical protein
VRHAANILLADNFAELPFLVDIHYLWTQLGFSQSGFIHGRGSYSRAAEIAVIRDAPRPAVFLVPIVVRTR